MASQENSEWWLIKQNNRYLYLIHESQIKNVTQVTDDSKRWKETRSSIYSILNQN